jgi:glycosyltransferase involved in cell wall biosynthesis
LPFFNGVDTERFSPQQRSAEVRSGLPGEGKCIALYAGLHGLAQGLDQLLEAAARLRNDDLRFLLVGDGTEKASLVEAARAQGLDNVTFHPARPREEIPGLLASADIAIVPLKRRLIGAVPSKLYEAMASGLPVVLVAEGEPADIVRSTGSGIVVAPGDIDGLAGAVRQLARSPDARLRFGVAAREAAVERFDRRRLCDEFIQALESDAGFGGPSEPEP